MQMSWDRCALGTFKSSQKGREPRMQWVRGEKQGGD